MDTISPELNDSDNKKESSRLIRFGKVQLQHWAVYLTAGSIVAFFLGVIFSLPPHQFKVSRNLSQLRETMYQLTISLLNSSSTASRKFSLLRKFPVFSSNPTR
jgi:hypothetical protein